MKIIGINDAHNASVCYTHDDEIIFALSEERPKHIKNYWGMPDESLKYIFDNFADKDEIDYFGIYRDTGGDFLIYQWAGNNQQKFTLAKKIIKPIIKRLATRWLEFISLFVSENMIRSYYANYLGVPIEKICLVNHHRAHAESAIFSLDKKKKWLIFTVDAEGDLESGTVHQLNAGKVDKLASIKRKNSLGYFYTWITEYLGMKPNEHEFKVMGLEPYVRKDTEEYKRVYEKISSLFYFDGLNYNSKISMITQHYKNWLRLNLYKERFDNIAAATQKTVESVITEWIQNWINETEIYNVALSGGTFMNVKLNQRIAEMQDVKSLYVVPTSGDETTVFGVCNYIYKEKSGLQLKPLSHLYLGVDWKDDELENWTQTVDPEKYDITFFGEHIEKKVAELLSQGEIVARFNGREEFGARALGNRSILAHPSNPETIIKINKLIKDRDFWMPFTPSILEENADEYIVNPNMIFSPYMSMTFDVTQDGKKDFSAAIHPYDETMRIQMVREDWNPKYYQLIKEFREYSGIGGILNTSFNLHGEPNVHTPNDALMTIENSGLQYLAIGKILIQKKT